MISAIASNHLKRQGFKRYLSQDTLAWVLIGLSSLLLGIWALKGTIALRNILLALESIISLYCISKFYRANRVSQQKMALIHFLPIVLLGLMFLWVICHFLFLTRYPQIQFAELTSTWLRAFLGAIVGAGTGLSILIVSKQKPHALLFLIVGIFFSFCFMLFQYLIKALSRHNVFAIDFDGYIAYGKISGVLMGIILISLILGTLLDIYQRPPQKINFTIQFFSLVSCLLAIYSYVFILNTRNGIALALFSVVQAILILIICKNKKRLCNLDHEQSQKTKLFSSSFNSINFLIILSGVVILLTMIYAHLKFNSGWYSVLEDAKIGMQIDQFKNWQNPQAYGYPQNIEGRTVVANTYERFAWASAGLRIFLPENPWGIGVLKEPFRILLLEKYPNAGAYIPSTHSAWVEIGLAYGYLGIILMAGSVLSIFLLAFSKLNAMHRYAALLLSSALLLLYLVGEVSSQHSIEMLCFLVAMLTCTLLSSNAYGTYEI